MRIQSDFKLRRKARFSWAGFAEIAADGGHSWVSQFASGSRNLLCG